MYNLPEINFQLDKSKKRTYKRKFQKFAESKRFWIGLGALALAVLLPYYIMAFPETYWHNHFALAWKKLGSIQLHMTMQSDEAPVSASNAGDYVSVISYEQAIIDAVKSASPSVVSIVISKNLPVYETEYIDPFEGRGDLNDLFDIQIPKQVQRGTQYKEVGAGSGFIVSQDGIVVTNKHVVLEDDADYTIVTNEGKRYTAKVLAQDPVQDIAIIKIDNAAEGEMFPAIKLGDSSGIQIGQGVIAIGNALGKFSNTVSVGIVSGLSRTVTASGSGGFSETLEDTIQTDTAINRGNSGGPLINLKGEVIGVNTAMADNAQSIGFSIPINIAKRDLAQVIKSNKIVYPFLGVRYVLVTQEVKAEYKLTVDYGALVIKGSQSEPAITEGSAAKKAGIKVDDVILEFNGEKVNQINTLAKLIQKYNPGDKVTIKILRGTEEITVETELGERS